MKKLLLFYFFFVFGSCSFDNKTGIWNDASTLPVEDKNSKIISEAIPDTRYENIYTKSQPYNDEKESDSFFNIQVDEPLKILNWIEQYAVPSNNIANFSYNANKVLLSKSSKLRKTLSNQNNIHNKIIFYNNNLVSYDHKGRIFIYSLDLNKKIFEYNFYKKNFKSFNKKISFVINENKLYAADNLGYVYAIDLTNNSILWAKNYGIPFRSNLKFANNQIFLANQDNVLLSINSGTGEKNWQFATSSNLIKTDFQNNLALDIIRDNIFFLNTSGELYSFNYLTQKINWVLNFKNASLPGDTELFFSQPIVIKNDNLIISTEKNILSYSSQTAVKNWSFLAEPIFKPIVTSNNTYVVLKNHLLICLDNTDGNVVWSKNILKNLESEKIIDNLNSIVDFKMINNEINIFVKKGHILSFNPNNGNLSSLRRLNKSGIKSEIFFINNKMLFVDSKNKLLEFD